MVDAPNPWTLCGLPHRRVRSGLATHMFRVLAIDGGGVRGIYPAHILDLLSAQVPGRALAGVFDLVIGTSTGAMVAAAVACGLPLQRVVALYEEKAPVIFGAKRFTLLGTLRSEYCSCPYRKLDRHGTSVQRHAVGVLNAGPKTLRNAGAGFLERGAIGVLRRGTSEKQRAVADVERGGQAARRS